MGKIFGIAIPNKKTIVFIKRKKRRRFGIYRQVKLQVKIKSHVSILKLPHKIPIRDFRN